MSAIPPVYPYKAVITQSTVLVLGDPSSIPLLPGSNITIRHEGSYLATASVMLNGKEVFGWLAMGTYQPV